MMKLNRNSGAIIMGIMVVFSFFSLALQRDIPVSPDDRIYELRTYTTHDGRLPDLLDRFNDHTVQFFAHHGMVNVGYWVPVEQENTLVYILSHESREAAERSWQAFLGDPDWQEVFDASRVDGPIVQNIESVFMKATQYSQIR